MPPSQAAISCASTTKDPSSRNIGNVVQVVSENFLQFVVKPAIAQLVEHLTVDCCRNQMVPGSIPGGRILIPLEWAFCDIIHYWIKCSTHRNRCTRTYESYALVRMLLESFVFVMTDR